MTAKSKYLVWLDLEMTGLNVDSDRILEIATVITDNELRIVAEGPVLAIHQPESVLDSMDEWNQKHHTQSGLVDRVHRSTESEAGAMQKTLDFLKCHVSTQSSPMCGNSVHQDRRFLIKYMSELEQYFHYRNLDVSTVKILAERWAHYLLAGFDKQSKHEALADIKESIEELRYYRKHFFSFIYDPINR